MKKILFSFIALMVMATFVTSCDKDDEPDGDNDMSSEKYEIVGSWVAYDSGTTLEMECYNNGSVNYVYTNSYGSTTNGSGRWHYYESGLYWSITGVPSMYVGDYIIMGGALRKNGMSSVVFYRPGSGNAGNNNGNSGNGGNSGDSGNSGNSGNSGGNSGNNGGNSGGNSGDNTSKGILAGTKWSGKVDGDYVELSFSAYGTLTEKYDGEVTTSSYLELDGQLVFGEGSVAYNTFGENPVDFTVNSSVTTLRIYNKYDSWNFTRKL